MNHRAVQAPPPRAHLAGTLTAVDRAGLTLPADARALFDRPQDLPEHVPPEAATLKYDLYLTAAATRAWGATINNTWEPVAFRRALTRFLGDREAPVRRLAAALGNVPATTCGLGFDHPDRPPRVKVYLEEARWGRGLIGAARLRTLARDQLDVEVPAWLADRALGVVTVELNPDGTTGLKLYPGGPTPASAAAGAPDTGALADLLTGTSPGPGYYYLTVRLHPGAPPRLAMNKVYNVTQAGFTGDRGAVDAAWAEVSALFARAGQTAALESLRHRLAGPDLTLVPTATAVEDAGRSVDVYLAAWAAPERVDAPR